MPQGLTRRRFLAGAAATGRAVGGASRAPRRRGPRPPRSRWRSATPTARSSCPPSTRMFDQLGGLGRLVKGRTVAVKVNLTGPAHGPPRDPARRAGAVGPPPGDRGGRPPHGAGGGAADPGAREPLVLGRAPRGDHGPGGMGPRRDPGRGPSRGAREHQLPREREGLPAVRRAGRRAALPLVPPAPRLPRLRHVRLPDQAQGPHHDRRHPEHEELLREHPHHGLRGPRPRGRAPARSPTAAGRRSSTHGSRQPPSLAAPEIDPASPRRPGLPHPAGGGGHLLRPAHRPRHHRRHRDHGGQRGPLGRGRRLPPGRAGGGHELRQHRRGGGGGHGLRPDGRRRGPRPSATATTSSSWPRRRGSAPATWTPSRSRARRSARRASTSPRSFGAASGTGRSPTTPTGRTDPREEPAMRLGIGTYTYTWAVGVPDHLPETPHDRGRPRHARPTPPGSTARRSPTTSPSRSCRPRSGTSWPSSPTSRRVAIEVGARRMTPDHLAAAHRRGRVLRLPRPALRDRRPGLHADGRRGGDGRPRGPAPAARGRGEAGHREPRPARRPRSSGRS